MYHTTIHAQGNCYYCKHWQKYAGERKCDLQKDVLKASTIKAFYIFCQDLLLQFGSERFFRKHFNFVDFNFQPQNILPLKSLFHAQIAYDMKCLTQHDSPSHKSKHCNSSFYLLLDVVFYKCQELFWISFDSIVEWCVVMI